MKWKILFSVLTALFLLATGAFGEEAKPVRTVVAGQIILNVHPDACGGKTVVIKDGIEVVFLSVENDYNEGKDGWPDVDNLVPGQVRHDAVTSPDGFYFIDNVEADKNFQIRRLAFDKKGNKRTQGFGHILNQVPTNINGVNVFWHRLEANFPGSVAISGIMND